MQATEITKKAGVIRVLVFIPDRRAGEDNNTVTNCFFSVNFVCSVANCFL